MLLKILITGKTGSGKSSLINGLVGKMVTIEGETLTTTTKHASGYCFCVGGISFLVVDSPGLQDMELEDTETLDLIKREITSVSDSFDLMIYCIDMTSKRVDASDKQAIVHLTECFGERIWRNAVFVLTFANWVSQPPRHQGTIVNFFTKRLEEFKKILDGILIKARVSENMVKDVPVIPAGYWEPVESIPNPWQLPDRPDWFNCFWIVCALRIESSASVAMFESQAERIKSTPLTETEMAKPAIKRPIFVPPEYNPLASSPGLQSEPGDEANTPSSREYIDVEIPKLKVIGSLVFGLIVGGGVGTLVGIPGGPLGMAMMGVAGAATGAAIGGSVAAGLSKLIKRHRRTSPSSESLSHQEPQSSEMDPLSCDKSSIQ